MASGSNALIQQLLKAEEEAEVIICRAKENRIKLLNDAAAAAEKDLLQFKETEEKKLLEEYNKESSVDDPNLSMLELRTKTFIDDCESRLREIKPLLVDKLVEATLNIKIPSPYL